MPIVKRVPEFVEGLTFIIKDVIVDHASVFRPNTQYRPEWAVVIRVPQHMVQEFYEVGFRLKQDPNTGGYTLRAKRYVRLDDGTEMRPPEVVDADENPWPEERGLIGNGSRCNVKVRAKYTTYQGVEGLSCYLEALQVVDHIPYTPGPSFGKAQGNTSGSWQQPQHGGGFSQGQQQAPPQWGQQPPQQNQSWGQQPPAQQQQQAPPQQQQWSQPQPPQQQQEPQPQQQQWQQPQQPPQQGQQPQQWQQPQQQGQPPQQSVQWGPQPTDPYAQVPKEAQGANGGFNPTTVAQGMTLPQGAPQGGNVSQPPQQQQQQQWDGGNNNTALNGGYGQGNTGDDVPF